MTIVQGQFQALLTTSDVALAAGVVPQTVRNAEAAGLLPAIRTQRGQRLFYPSDAIAWIAARNAAKAQPPEAEVER